MCCSIATLRALVTAFADCEPPTDWQWLHEVGTGCDDTELPHHVSSPVVITGMVGQAEEVLRGLPPPKVITIARSAFFPSVQRGSA